MDASTVQWTGATDSTLDSLTDGKHDMEGMGDIELTDDNSSRTACTPRLGGTAAATVTSASISIPSLGYGTETETGTAAACTESLTISGFSSTTFVS